MGRGWGGRGGGGVGEEGVGWVRRERERVRREREREREGIRWARREGVGRECMGCLRLFRND